MEVRPTPSNKLVTEIIENCLESEAALEELPPEFFSAKFENRVAAKAVHYLAHFWADSDLRTDDPEYDTTMQKELSQFVIELGRVDKLSRIECYG